MTTPYLTKSRFKLATQCPAKLLYTGRKEYVDANRENELLQGLAEGGFQIGALAQAMLAREAVRARVDWTEIVDRDRQQQIDATRDHLEKDEVTIFEATIQTERFLIRIDALRKRGNQLDLIEVKSKSFDSRECIFPRTEKGSIDRDFRPYLEDVAFQAMVLRMAYPDANIRCFLMMPDKAKVCEADGLHQLLAVQYQGTGESARAFVPMPELDQLPEFDEPFLREVNVDSEVWEILEQPMSSKAPGWTGLLADLANQWADVYEGRAKIQPPIGTTNCGICEFYTATPGEGQRSGWHECWKEVLEGETLSREETVLGLYKDSGGHKKKKLFANQVFRLRDISREDLGVSELPSDSSELTNPQRQWMQVSGELPGNSSASGHYFSKVRFEEERSNWEYPYFFLDFEGIRTALPFRKGQRPNAINAFQYSVHVMQEDGRVEHLDQFLDLDPDGGMHVRMLRRLKETLGEKGTVFRWHNYENILLNEIREELLGQTGADENLLELVGFIDSLTDRKAKLRGEPAHRGHRSMVDQSAVASRFYFHPSTGGSSSIKKLLPAMMSSSNYLKEKYSRPIYGGDGPIPSLNYKNGSIVWWQADPDGTGRPRDPYDLLSSTVSDSITAQSTDHELMQKAEALPEGILNDGAGAMMAYIRLQSGRIPEAQALDLQQAMLRYCELDTLAMVMIMEAWINH